MLINIEIDDKLIAEAKKALGVSSVKEAVTVALQRVVEGARIERQKAMLRWKGKIDWQGDLDEWRRD